MKDFSQILRDIAHDVKVKAMEEFDKNFERKAFFDKPWAATKLANKKGSLMLRSGNLRRSLNSKLNGSSIVIWSNLPYADIHNSGGEIKVTYKMQKYFWAQYYKSIGKVKISAANKKQGEHVKLNASNTKLATEARIWKSLALKPVGSVIRIKKRQFIGNHPVITNAVKSIYDYNMQDVNNAIINSLKPKKR